MVKSLKPFFHEIMSEVKLKLLIVMLLVLAFPLTGRAQATADEKIGSIRSREELIKQSPHLKLEGVVVLSVTFLESGEVGEVELVSGLSDALNQQAIASARKIKYEPARKNGVAASVTKKVEYTFFKPFEENDPELRSNAEFTKKPVPESPKGKKFNGIGGKVKLSLTLNANGKVQVDKIKSDLPKEFEDRARVAALKIKFNPAVAKDGREVTQIKEFEYEFKPEND